jgi:uncharacterized membrane-anchored protein
MIRRTITFIGFVALVAAVSALAYFNPAETVFHYSPTNEITLPLGVLMLSATITGMVVMFLLMLAREGRNAVREWRVQRGIRSAERTASLRAEARSFALAGDYARARTLFTKTMKLRNPDVGDLIDYADTYLQEGNAKEAKRVLENGQKDFGNAPLLLRAIAIASRQAGDDAAAISALERALAVYPRSLRLLVPLRDTLIDNGSWGRAQEIQQRVLQLRPSDPKEANRLLGLSYEAALRHAPIERLAALKAIANNYPEFTPAIVERARTLHAEGDSRRALRVLEKALRRRPRGVLFDELERISDGDSNRLAKVFLKSVESHPTLDGLRARTARHLLRSQRYDEATDLLKESTSSDTRGVLAAARSALQEAQGRLGRESGGVSPGVTDVVFSAPPWACEECGTLSDRWVARCLRCGAWGSVDDL